MRVLVCGGRDYVDCRHVFQVLDKIDRERWPITCVIHGDARGADSLAREWVACMREEGREMLEAPFRAAWDDLNAPGAVVKKHLNGKLYNASAGIARNARMLSNGKPDLVVAFPGGRGTANMVDLARKAGVEVLVLGRKADSAMNGEAS